MNTQKFTQKSIQAIMDAQSEAIERKHMQLEVEHIIYALFTQENGLIPRLVEKIGLDLNSAIKVIEKFLGKIPSVSGPGREAGKIYVSQDVENILLDSEKESAKFKDEYVSVEHIMIALFESNNKKASEIFNEI